MCKSVDKGIYSLGLNDKLDLIEKIEDGSIGREDGINLLSILAKDEESEVRLRVSEILISFNSDGKMEELLFSLTYDKDYLVRASACDSISGLNNPQSISILEKVLEKDKSKMVKAYAALSLSEVCWSLENSINSSIAIIKDKLVNESNSWVKIFYYAALYRLGVKEYLNYLIVDLNSNSYRTRCAVVNLVKDLILDDLIEDIESISLTLKDRILKEDSTAVISSINKVLELIDQT